VYEYEAAHGTVQRHYYNYLKGISTSTNPTATIYAWTGALKKRGEMDNIPELVSFGDKLEKAVIKTIENGYMTKGLCELSSLENKKSLNTVEFLDKIKETLDSLI
jgi:isocitrate dehydrogenase